MQQTIATNVATLNKALLEEFNGLRMGQVKEKRAKEAANLAGKYLKGISVQIDYKKLTGSKNKIDGL